LKYFGHVVRAENLSTDTLHGRINGPLVGLASHWPCVTDSSGLSTYGLNGREWEMITPPTPQLGHGSLYLLHQR